MESTVTPPVAEAPIAAEELHQVLLEAHTVGNKARRKFILAFYAMHALRRHLALGCSNIGQYGEKYFGIQRSQAYAYLEVAKVLRKLPLCDAAFENGKLYWCALREIARIADTETEEKWLEYARTHSLRQLKAEVRDALEKGRTEPRCDGYGLPRLPQTVMFSLDPEELDIAKKALTKMAHEAGESLDKRRVTMKDAFLHMCRQILMTDPGDGQRVERDQSPYTILYHQCPTCEKATLPTTDGPVDLPKEVVERVEGDADTECTCDGFKPNLDRPNTYTIVKKIKLRDGLVCSNPLCRRKLGLHAHHIKFRSKGGKTKLSNECLLCCTCHALIHAGLLELTGTPLTGLKWKAKADELTFDLEKELEQLSSSPEIRYVGDSERSESGPCHSERSESARFHSERSDSIPQHTLELARALINLGCTKEDSRRRIEKAWAIASKISKKPTDEEILRLALRG
jgi:hypothetical protein